MRILFFSICFLAVLVGKAQNVLPAQNAGKWGLLHSTTYQIIVPYLYKEMQISPEGSCMGFGTPENPHETVFFDAKGKEFLRLKNEKKDNYSPFNGDLAAFLDEANLIGFIDRTGKKILPARYILASPFHENMAIVKDQDKNFFQIIDRTGKVQASLDSAYRDISLFSEGIAFVKTEPPLYVGDLSYTWKPPTWGKTMMIDKQGKVLADFTNNEKIRVTHNFEQGLAVVGVTPMNYDGMEEKYTADEWGVIDRAGKFILPIEYSKIEIEPNGTILATKATGITILFDKQGKPILNGEESPAYTEISPLIAQRFRFVKSNDQEAKWGVLDATNGYKRIVPTNFEAIYSRPPTDFWVIEKWEYLQKQHEFLEDFITYQKWGRVDFYTYTRTLKTQDSMYVFMPNSASHSKSFQYKGKFGILDDKNLAIKTTGYDSIPAINEGSYADLIPAQKRGKWGYLNHEGEIIIQPQFEEVENSPLFYEGYAAVKKAGKWGIIDKSGKIITPFEYESISTPHIDIFTHKYYREAKKNGLIGLLDENSKLIVPCQFQLINAVSSEYFIGTDSKGRQGVSDYTGKVLMAYEYETLTNPRDHNTLFFGKKAGKAGIVNLGDKVILPFAYDSLKSIYYSPQFIYAYKAGKVGIEKLQNEQSKTILPTEYDAVELKGNFWKVKKNGKWGALNDKQVLFVPCEYDELGDKYNLFTKLYTPFQKNGLIGILDNTGKEILPAEYEEIDYPREPFLSKKGGKFGVVNAQNKVIIPFEYDKLEEAYTEDNYCWRMTKNNKEGILSQTNEIIVPIQYDELGHFTLKDGLLMGAKKQNKWGYINAKQKMVISAMYEDAKVFQRVAGKTLAIVKKGGRWGIINEKNKIVVPFLYEEIYVNDNKKGLFQAKMAEKYITFDAQGKEVKE